MVAPKIIRRDSRCPWLDFVQRVRLGVIVLTAIIILAWGLRWLV